MSVVASEIIFRKRKLTLESMQLLANSARQVSFTRKASVLALLLASTVKLQHLKKAHSGYDCDCDCEVDCCIKFD